MAEIADEELSGTTPIDTGSSEHKFKKFGYWTDSRGIKHKGIIPESIKLPTQTINFNSSYDDPERIRTSDPRKYIND